MTSALVHRTLIAVAAFALTACAGSPAAPSAPQASTPQVSAPAQSSDAPATSGAVPVSISRGLARFGVDGTSPRDIIDALDRTNDDRTAGPRASVRQKQLLLTDGSEEFSMPMPVDSTYVAIAPYVTTTHECFNHNLATCQGEQVRKAFTVTITDSAGKVLVDRTETTYDNGFVGFWLPRDVRGSISVSAEGRRGTIEFGTGDDDPTCLTTLRLT